MKQAGLLIVLIACSVCSGALQYQAVDLGFGGEGRRIDDDYTVSGNYESPTQPLGAMFSWKDGVFTHTGDSSVEDQFWWSDTSNSSGQRISNEQIGGSGSSHMLLWEGVDYTDLGVGWAFGINENSQVVGYRFHSYAPDIPGMMAFLWDDGQFTNLGTLGGTGSRAFGINDRGMVVGASYRPGNAGRSGFVWYKGEIQELSSPFGSSIPSWAYSINETGHIAGYWNSSGEPQAMLWAPGPAADFDLDDDVDGVDFGIWQVNYPLTSGATFGDGDADYDGDVDGADFGIWQNKYPTAALVPLASVPEPATSALLLVGGLAILRRRRAV